MHELSGWDSVYGVSPQLLASGFGEALLGLRGGKLLAGALDQIGGGGLIGVGVALLMAAAGWAYKVLGGLYNMSQQQAEAEAEDNTRLREELRKTQAWYTEIIASKDQQISDLRTELHRERMGK